MNRTWMLSLYPDDWRARYEPEFRDLLEHAPMSIWDTLDIMFGAVDAHLRPQMGLGGGGSRPEPTPAPPAPGARERLVRWLLMHAGVVLFASVFLLVINLLTGTDVWWAPIVTWALAMPLSLHAMVVYRWRGAFGMLAVPLAVANIGLIGLNIGFSPDVWWSLWTLSASAIPVIGAGLVAFRIMTLDRAIAISGALVTLLLAVVAIFEPSIVWTVVAEALFVVALMVALRKLTTRAWSLFGAHVFLAVVLNILMIGQNLLQDPDTIWFTYVLAAASIPLAIHGLVRWGMLGFADATWEQAKIAQLTERMQAFADADEVQRRIFWTARIQRTFWSHIFLSAVVAIDLAIINILSGTEQPWAIWPVATWAVVLGIHAGYAFSPNRWLGAHTMLWLGIGAGLIAIDTWEPAARWWPWPVAAYGMLLAAHIGWIVAKPRWYGMLVGFCVAFIPFVILANGMTGDPVWWYWPAMASVAVIAIATPVALMLVQRIARWESGKMTSRPRNS